MSGQNLNRNGSIETSVPCAIHLAHASRANGRLDFIGTEFSSSGEGHGWRQLYRHIDLTTAATANRPGGLIPTPLPDTVRFFCPAGSAARFVDSASQTLR